MTCSKIKGITFEMRGTTKLDKVVELAIVNIIFNILIGIR